MQAVDFVGSTSGSFVGRRSPTVSGNAGRPQSAAPSADGRDLLLSVLVALAGLMAAVVLAPVGGLRALAIGLLALVLVAFAIGRWLRLQQRIRSVATEWQQTVDAVDSPILTLDFDGRILRMNRAAMLLSGRPYSQNLGKRIAELGPGEPWRSAADRVDRVRAGRGAQVVRFEDPDTGESWEITVPRVHNPGSEGPTIVVVARNVTELVALQESLHQQELMAAMGALVGGVAHDMRNFLFAFNGTLEVFEKRFGDCEDQQPFFQMLRSHSGRINGLMQSLLDYGKPIRLAPQPQAVGDVIAEARDICAAAAAEKGVELVVHPNGDLPRIPLDPTRILQVFKNLIENAVQHSPENGTVQIETELLDKWIECRIRDSGPGLGETESGRIFEPFFTKRKGGTGLGLTIVQHIVKEHGGEINAINHPEGGAEFRVRLPLTAAA